MMTSIPYSPNTSPRLTPPEATDGDATLTCHTKPGCVGVPESELIVPLFGYAIVGERVTD